MRPAVRTRNDKAVHRDELVRKEREDGKRKRTKPLILPNEEEARRDLQEAELEEENWAEDVEDDGARDKRRRCRVDEFRWEAKWPLYGLAWAQGAIQDGTTRPLRMAVGSFLEDRYTNKGTKDLFGCVAGRRRRRRRC
jgi:hypothetical protein